jgi:hypothetical protein
MMKTIKNGIQVFLERSEMSVGPSGDCGTPVTTI